MCNGSPGFQTKVDDGSQGLNGSNAAMTNAGLGSAQGSAVNYAGQSAFQLPGYSMTPGSPYAGLGAQIAASYVPPNQQYSNGSQYGRWNMFNNGNPFARNGQTPGANPFIPQDINQQYPARPYTTPGTWNLGGASKPYLPAGQTTTNPGSFTQPGNVNSAPGAAYGGVSASVDPSTNPISTTPGMSLGSAPSSMQKQGGPAPFTPGAGFAQTDASGAFAGGGDMFNMGGQNYSANDILSKFYSLPQEQQQGLYGDTLVSNALGVNMGRNAANQLVQKYSAGGSGWSPNAPTYNWSALFGNLGQK